MTSSCTRKYLNLAEVVKYDGIDAITHDPLRIRTDILIKRNST
jgi:hypothetical protein